MTDPLPADVAEALAAPGARQRLRGLADAIRYHHTVPSTNALALELAAAGASDGTTVLASAQTAGRGRRGRVWFSPGGVGLYMSVILRDVDDPALTLLAGVAVTEAIRAVTGLPVELKWPNDVVLGSGRDRDSPARGKVAGILCEACPAPGVVTSVVVGVGVNLARVEYPAELGRRAAALEDHAEKPVPRGALMVSCLAGLGAWRERQRAEGRAVVLARWRELSPSSAGASVRWQDAGRDRVGTTAGLDDDGALRVQVGDRVERIVGGTLDWLAG